MGHVTIVETPRTLETFMDASSWSVEAGVLYIEDDSGNPTTAFAAGHWWSVRAQETDDETDELVTEDEAALAQESDQPPIPGMEGARPAYDELAERPVHS